MKNTMRDKCYEALEKQISNINGSFLAFAWRDFQHSEYLQTATKYEALVRWLDRRINMSKSIIEVLHPSQDVEYYTKGFFNSCFLELGNLAYCTLQREMLISSETTAKERECIERRLCSTYEIRYSENIKEYIDCGKEENNK